MLQKAGLLLVMLALTGALAAQWQKESIHTDVVLLQKRQRFDKYLHDKTVAETFALPLDSNSEYRYESACMAITQFQLRSSLIEAGLEKMFNGYSSLSYSARRALLEVSYGVYPHRFTQQVYSLIQKETVPKLFAMQALYLYSGKEELNLLLQIQGWMKQLFPAHDSIPLLQELKRYLALQQVYKNGDCPPVQELFNNPAFRGQKIIYSFQRWNRDYPGLAVVQYADGSFARDSAGRLQVFRQLARAASNLPYFITNGNTPQGIFSIQGTAISHNHLIGPTPNIQMILPFEADSLYWHGGYDSSGNALDNYLSLLPESWRGYQPVTEAFYAGKIGRSEIIAHGTTINPEYFSNMPYYPLTPTQGCLCAREIWNESNGTLADSEQFNLASAFTAKEGNTGYLIVINLDNQLKEVSAGEIEMLIKSR